MKRLIIPALMAMAMLASCGGTKTQNTEKAPSAEEQTSLGVDKNLTSPDLSLYELHGPVKNLKLGDFEESDNYTFYEFTGDGRLYSVNGDKTMFKRTDPERVMMDDEGTMEDLPVYRRNSNGEISEVEYMESINQYTWENGQMVKNEWECEGAQGLLEYTYDANGDLVQMSEKTKDLSEEDWSEASVVKYKITKRDKYGNWIARDVLSEDPWSETRAIEYYD